MERLELRVGLGIDGRRGIDSGFGAVSSKSTMKKRLMTILGVIAVALAVAFYPLIVKVQTQVWALGLSGAAVWMFQQRELKRQLLLPCVIASVLLAFAAGILSGNLCAAVGFMVYGVFTAEGLRKLSSQFDWEVMLGTAGAAVLAIWFIIELF